LLPRVTLDLLSLKILLPADEWDWLSSQRARPLAILSQLRRKIYAERDAGRVSDQMQYILDLDIKELGGVHAACERLFTSPIPPNMARHGMRSLTLWLCALPVVLVGQLPPLCIAAWAFTTSYIYIGIDELGAQARTSTDERPVCHTPPC
jgi:predicted membrane chloride channel (bestrophin family)